MMMSLKCLDFIFQLDVYIMMLYTDTRLDFVLRRILVQKGAKWVTMEKDVTWHVTVGNANRLQATVSVLLIVWNYTVTSLPGNAGNVKMASMARDAP